MSVNYIKFQFVAVVVLVRRRCCCCREPLHFAVILFIGFAIKLLVHCMARAVMFVFCFNRIGYDGRFDVPFDAHGARCLCSSFQAHGETSTSDNG